MKQINIIGYYKESPLINKQGKKNENFLYMIVFKNSTLDGSKEWLEGYNVMDGHFEIKDKKYLLSCEEVTKNQYIEATKGWYTPETYLL